MTRPLHFLRQLAGAASLASLLMGAALLLAACGGGDDETASDRESPAAVAAPAANLALTSAATDVVLTSDSQWRLDKTGSLSGNTVTWNITATKTATTSGHLLIQGQMTVANTGNGPATIGNIVVNLQKRVSNNWVSASANVANASQGDAATTAKIHAVASSENKSSFTENAASGSLNFMDASNNTVFSLTPQVMIGAGQSKTLLFSAEFNNNAAPLKLTAGTAIRAEVIVSFGNATQSGNSTANVDINGNGSVDADEARVRSVPSRLGLTVPAAVNGNTTVALTDTLADISATGDVQFSNVVFNLGATSGTVTANVTGGTNGGSVTNCAHLRSADQNVGVGGFNFPIVDGVDLQSCSTVDVAGSPPTCTPGAPGCGWKSGEMFTANQGSWDTGTAANALGSNFTALYSGSLVVGGTLTMTFTNATAVATYLPTLGSPAALNANLTNPLTSSAGELGGQVLALQLNSDLSTAFGNDVSFGGLRICGFALAPAVNNMTVDEFLGTANWILGGGSAAFGAGTANAVANLLNNAFAAGAPSAFAQSNLVAAATCAN
jgi:hypothetical protein